MQQHELAIHSHVLPPVPTLNQQRKDKPLLPEQAFELRHIFHFAE
jgi:hypothetical protein